jgi:hypothetical protein
LVIQAHVCGFFPRGFAIIFRLPDGLPPRIIVE